MTPTYVASSMYKDYNGVCNDDVTNDLTIKIPISEYSRANGNGLMSTPLLKCRLVEKEGAKRTQITMWGSKWGNSISALFQALRNRIFKQQ